MKNKFRFQLTTKDGIFLELDVLNCKDYRSARRVINRQCPEANVVSVLQYHKGKMIHKRK